MLLPRKVAQLLDRDETNDSTSDGWEACWIESEPKGEYRSGLEFSQCLSSLTLREAVEKNLVSFRWWGPIFGDCASSCCCWRPTLLKDGAEGQEAVDLRLRCACTIDGVRLRILGIVVDLWFLLAVCEKAIWHTHRAHMPREGRMMGDALAERSLRIEEVVDTAACVASRGTKCASVEPSCASTP